MYFSNAICTIKVYDIYIRHGHPTFGMTIQNSKDLKWSKSEDAVITPSSKIQNADESSCSKRFEREKHLEFRGIRASVGIYDKIRNIPVRSSDIREPRLDEVIKSQYNSIEELKKDLKENDERTAGLEKENAELKEQLSKK